MKVERAGAVVYSLKMASLPITINSICDHLFSCGDEAAQVRMSSSWDRAVRKVGSSMWTPRMSRRLCVWRRGVRCVRMLQSVEYNRMVVKPFGAIVEISEEIVEEDLQVRDSV